MLQKFAYKNPFKIKTFIDKKKIPHKTVGSCQIKKNYLKNIKYISLRRNIKINVERKKSFEENSSLRKIKNSKSILYFLR